MAAALLQKRVTGLRLSDDVRVVSAGVWAREGQTASANASAVLAERGISLDSHRSQLVSVSLLEQADIVLVMEEAHRRSLFYLAPQYLSKIFLLSEMSGGHEDVTDPFGGPREEYLVAVDRLEGLLDAGLPNILRRIGVKSKTPDTGLKIPETGQKG